MLSYWHRNVAGAGLVVLGLGEALYMLTSAEFWITGFSEMDIDTGTIEGSRTLEQWHSWVGATQAVLTMTAIFTLLAAFRASRGHVDYLVLLGVVHAAGAVAVIVVGYWVLLAGCVLVTAVTAIVGLRFRAQVVSALGSNAVN